MLALRLPLLAVLTSVLMMAGCQSNGQRHDLPSERGAADSRQRLVHLAAKQIGVPYRYGGNDTKGFDCSGLVHYTHARLGIAVPRTAAAQQRAAGRVPLHALRAGDLLFFRIDGGKGDHVGIYAGEGRFIHAPSSGKRVSEGHLDSPYWRERLTGAGSYL